MLQTAKLQTVFKSALLQRNMRPVEDFVGTPGHISADIRTNVYQNNMYMSLMDVIENAFPTVRELIGHEPFRNTARQFVKDCPPTSGCLYEYGDEFPGFLKGFEPLKSLAYLPDVATLDWARNEVYYESDTTPFDSSLLVNMNDDDLCNTVFTLPQALRFVQSDYNLQDIWAMTYEDYQGEVHVHAKKSCALIVRPQMSIDMYWLDDLHFDLYQALVTKQPIGQILDQLSKTHEDQDLQAALAFFIQHSIFTQQKQGKEND